MRNLFFHRARPALSRKRLAVVFGLTVWLMTGCSSPSSDDGVVTGTVDVETETVAGNIPLPTDTLLNLYCLNVGLSPNVCVLDDPENPWVGTATREFDVNNPDAETKFELANKIPAGENGAKARFYLWATALARRPSGENQYYTALALHELFTAAEDPIIREQALRAYKNVWDTFFGSVTVFECCGEFFPPPGREDTAFAVPLNEEVLERLVRAPETPAEGYPGGFTPLVPEDLSTVTLPPATDPDPGLVELETAEVILDWEYFYRCTGAGTQADPRLCVVSVAIF